MRLLKIKISGAALLDDNFEVNFCAEQRVSANDKESLSHVVSNIYTHSVLAFVGINASGKTLSLKTLSFVMQMLDAKPINTIRDKYICHPRAGRDSVIIESYFALPDESINKLVTHIGVKQESPFDDEKFIITDEFLYSKKVSSSIQKKNFFHFEDKIHTQRKADEAFLLDDVSIMVSVHKWYHTELMFIDLMAWTDYNSLLSFIKVPAEVTTYLDSSIEYLHVTPHETDRERHEFQLKFHNSEEIVGTGTKTLEKYLSSGTIKGMNVFFTASFILWHGGYLLVDELENHFNREIVATLIRFFLEKDMRNKPATLIFSTHYPELLDELNRNDSIYITRKEHGVTLDPLSRVLDRNDVKKSEYFKSGYNKNTVPAYDAYIAMKRAFKRRHGKQEE